MIPDHHPMTHLLPAGRASRQHSSPGASQEGGWALPAAVLMQMGWEVTSCSPEMRNLMYPLAGWVMGVDEDPLS